MEDTIIETTLRHCFRHLADSTKTLDDNRRLAQSLQMYQAIYPETPSPSQEDKRLLVPKMSLASKLAEMENCRAENVNNLRDIVIEMCEQSATTLRNPTEKNQQKLQDKIEAVDSEFKMFQTQISLLKRKLDKMEANVLHSS